MHNICKLVQGSNSKHLEKKSFKSLIKDLECYLRVLTLLPSQVLVYETISMSQILRLATCKTQGLNEDL